MNKTRTLWALVAVMLACGGLGSKQESSQDEVADITEPETPQPIASTPEPPPPPEVEVDDTAPPCPPTEPTAEPEPPEATASLTGTIERALPSGVILTMDPGNRPSVGSQAIIYKKIDQDFAGMSVTAWVDIGLVEVVPARGAKFKVKILERHSEMVINGETKDHFEAGSIIRLDW
jgi:hypothetical protein